MIATDTVVLEPGYYHAGAVYQVVQAARGHQIIRRGRLVVAIVTGAGLEWRTGSELVRGQVLIAAADPGAARLAYAASAGRCWRCARRLTDPDSTAAGVGPECRAALAKEPIR